MAVFDLAAPVLNKVATLALGIPFEYLLIGHCISVATWTRSNHAPLVSLLLGFVAAFGGGIATWLLFQVCFVVLFISVCHVLSAPSVFDGLTTALPLSLLPHCGRMLALLPSQPLKAT